MLPSYYEFINPVKIVSGNKAVDNIPYELNQLGVKRPMIVTDQGVVMAGLLKVVENAIADSELAIGAVYDTTPPDSSLEVVKEIAGIYRSNRCDSFIAIGGGSSMDTAKGVNIAITENSDDLSRFIGAEMLKNRLQPFVAIPTTAGTGSEVTSVAVISDTENNVKMPFTSHYLLPNVAILDPRMTLTLPPKLTAATAMDAMTHAIESFINLQKNPMSDAYATAAIKIIRENVVNAVKNGKDADTRLALANAATMAGIAFSNSMVGLVHSLGHATGGICHVPHGIAMSIFLPFGMEYNLEKARGVIGELLLPLGGSELFACTPKTSRAEAAIKIVRKLQTDLYSFCGLPMTLKDAGVPRNKLEQIAQAVMDDGALTFNPEAVNQADALRVLKMAYE
ncbi:MAG: alcohol dehydrogenase [Desulfobacterium sp.]|nr:alcohol dehydrogenase [Desulfobacterium sp.]